MIAVEVVGYKKLTKNEKTLYYLSTVAYGVEGTVGMTAYTGFVDAKQLEEKNITETDLIGSEGHYITTKNNETYRSFIKLLKKGK